MATIGSYDPVAAKEVLWTATAPTSRSTCKIEKCGKTINEGDTKVCCMMWLAGRNSQVGFHPPCFVNNALSVETVEKGGVGKCKKTGKKFERGDVRVVVNLRNGKFCLSASGAKSCLPAVLKAAGGRKLTEIPGFGKLSACDKKALGGDGQCKSSGAKPKAVRKTGIKAK